MVGIGIGCDMHVIKKNFSLLYPGITVHQAGPAFSERFYLWSQKNESSLQNLINKIIISCLFILAYKLNTHVDFAFVDLELRF